MVDTIRDIEEITDFLFKYGYYPDKEKLKDIVSKYLEYGTYVLVRDNEDEIVAVAGFNIHGKTAEVLETIVRPDFRFKRIPKLLVLMSKIKFPFLEYFWFERENKYPNRKEHIYSIGNFLRR